MMGVWFWIMSLNPSNDYGAPAYLTKRAVDREYLLKMSHLCCYVWWCQNSVGSMTENDVWGLVGTKRVKLSHLGECLGPPTLWVLAGAPYTLKLIKFQAVERLQEGNEVPDCREFQCSCQSKGLCYLQSYVRLYGDQELGRKWIYLEGINSTEDMYSGSEEMIHTCTIGAPSKHEKFW